MDLKRIILTPYIILLFIIATSFTLKKDTGFKGEQLSYERVREAYKDKMQYLQTLYYNQKVNFFDQHIFLRAFKAERELELWAKNTGADTFSLIYTYNFCKASGCVGPKRSCGDKQVPEGFYYINQFNPVSKYYLSLGINYPNASDKILGNKSNAGGDIFIHGNCVSSGCIAVTDDVIKEIYVVAVEAKAGGQTEIPVHIFPSRLTDSAMTRIKEIYKQEALVSFWANLKTGHDYFEHNKKLPTYQIDLNGKYVFVDEKSGNILN